MTHGLPADEPTGGPGAVHTFESVPLFPLPGVVLFPRAVLPLHIFEERYKAMTADALRGNRRIAMALLKPGWEKNYHGRPSIEPIVCVGDILTHEKLADGKYNFLLQGLARATIVRERIVGELERAYRVADLQTLPETPCDEEDLIPHRRQMAELLGGDLAAVLPAAPQFVQMLASPLPTAMVADLIAFHVFDDASIKQKLLSEGNVARRVARVADALSYLQPPVKPLRPQAPPDPTWN